ncbi:MAG: HNH endonuclease [Deltaproteobacteria bacterium]|nr:HNH endonuclease [Deltaproteobacteria bacterium]
MTKRRKSYEPFTSCFDDAHMGRERQKARVLRQSEWWKRRLARGTCHYCNRSFPPSELTMDHIAPIVRGGKSTKGNVVPACKECNTRKKYLFPVEWEEYLSSIGKENPGL